MESILHKIKIINCFKDLIDIVSYQQELLVEIADGQGLAINPMVDLKLASLEKNIGRMEQDLGIKRKA